MQATCINANQCEKLARACVPAQNTLLYIGSAFCTLATDDSSNVGMHEWIAIA